MQQEATKIGFSIERTQKIAQALYERGAITYIRTDCATIAEEFIDKMQKYIVDKFGEKYIGKNPNLITKSKKVKKEKAKAKKGDKGEIKAQEAHECIRPTDLNFKIGKLSDSEKRLYKLIFNRTIASMMKPALFDKLAFSISISKNKKYLFTSDKLNLKFDGFLAIYNVDLEDEIDDDCSSSDERKEKTMTKKKTELLWKLYNKIEKGDQMDYDYIYGHEKFTTPPARYTEATIVKDLEKKGIGRPSTYVSSYQVNIARNYIVKENRPGKKLKVRELTLSSEDKKITEKSKDINSNAQRNKLFPTDLGIIINKLNEDNFSKVINYDFTAQLEGNLDKIAKGDEKEFDIMKKFYDDFKPMIDNIKKKKETTFSKELGSYKDKKIHLKINSNGPYIMWGGNLEDKEEKPLFFSVTAKESQEIDIEKAKQIIKRGNEFPKKLGKSKYGDIYLCKGRYGIYIQSKDDGTSKNYSIPNIDKYSDKSNLSLSDVKDIIGEYKEKLDKGEIKEKKSIRVVNNKSGKKSIEILDGMYGPYFRFKNKNISIPAKYKKTPEIFEKWTFEECFEVIKEKYDSGYTGKKKKFIKKKA